MTNNIVTDIKVIKEAGAIFASSITTEFVELSNYKYVDFIISTGVGTVANTTLTIVGKSGESGTTKAIAFREKVGSCEYENIDATGKVLSIGGTAGNCGKVILRITADNLAHDECDRVAIKTTAVASSAVPGSIVAILYEPRFSK